MLNRVGGTKHELAFGLNGKRACNLMDPAVHADFVSFGCDAALFIRIQRRGHARNEEGSADILPMQHLENARDSNQASVLAPAQAADRLAAVAQLIGLMITVK